MKNICRLALLLCTLLLAAQAAWAVPALERTIVLTQPDGSRFEAYQRGDERAHWMASQSDDYVIAQNDDHWWCFAVVEDGKIKPSCVRYSKDATPPAGAVKRFAPQPRRTIGG